MKALHENWVTEGILDVEYKKYILLAYLQGCKASFGETRLYPPLADLVQHYRNLSELKTAMESLHEQFPKEVLGVDPETLEVLYDAQVPSDEYISTITEVLEFALPTLRDTIKEGRDIFEFVEKHIEITPVGIEPIYRDEGFLLVNEEPSADVFIYSFRHSIIPHSGENLRQLGLTYHYAVRKSITNSVEQIKLDLTRRFRDMPNPATFFCRSHLQVPLSETLLPVSKRLLMKRLAA